MSVHIKAATQDNLRWMKALAKQAGIVTVDVSDLDQYWIATFNDVPIGMSALEAVEKFGLLKSVAVIDSMRGKGVGTKLVKHVLDIAKKNKMSCLYLLTEGSGELFAYCGFEICSRAGVPAEIKHTAQFDSLCPSSATVMRKAL